MSPTDENLHALDDAWERLRACVHARHTVERENADEIAFRLTIEGWRQLVVVSRATCEGTAWLVLSAPVAGAAQSCVLDALRLMSRSVVGALALEGDRLLVRHAEPLERVSPDRLEELAREVALGVFEIDAMSHRARADHHFFHHYAD